MTAEEIGDYRKLLFSQIKERYAILKSLPVILGPWEEADGAWVRCFVESGNVFSIVDRIGEGKGKKWAYSADLAEFELSRVAKVNTRDGAMTEIDAITEAAGVLLT